MTVHDMTIGILMLVKRVVVDTSVLLRCYYAFVVLILEYCYPVWGCAAKCLASRAPRVFGGQALP